MSTPKSKSCARCGRTITWRRKWSRDWDAVRYCSDRCRRQRSDALDETIEARILELLDGPPRTASICPSEVARALASDAGPVPARRAVVPNRAADTDGEPWRALLEPVRAGARRLVARGALEITQGGRVVDPSRARGPIRLRLPRRG